MILALDARPARRAWLALPAQNQHERALSPLDEPNRYGHWWTAEELRTVLQQRSAGTRPPIAWPLHSAPGKERIQIFDLEARAGHVLEYTAPPRLSSSPTWHELAVRFEFRDKAEGFHVALEDFRIT
jgi:hypothetical protein